MKSNRKECRNSSLSISLDILALSKRGRDPWLPVRTRYPEPMNAMGEQKHVSREGFQTAEGRSRHRWGYFQGLEAHYLV